MFLCKFGGENPTGSQDRAQKRLILLFFKDGDLENEVSLKIGSKSLKSYQLNFATMIQKINYSLNNCSIQEISYKNTTSVKI